MSIWLGDKKLAGDIVKYSHNIGDIFYTSRTDTILAGAVECNGATYQTTDYTGTGSIGELLSAGKLPYISLSQYASDLAAHGSVRAFGWDGGTSTAFRVPTLQNVFLEAGQAASAGEYISAGLPNITGSFDTGDRRTHISNANGAFYRSTAPSALWAAQSSSTGNVQGVGFEASRSSSIYGNSTTVQPNSVKYRAMVQLFNGITDEALVKVGDVYYTPAANNTSVYAPSGGKWLVLYVAEVNISTAVLYLYTDDLYHKVGEIVNGGTQITQARSGYGAYVSLLKIS